MFNNKKISNYETKKRYTPYEINKYKKRKRQEEFLKTLDGKAKEEAASDEQSFASVTNLRTVSIAVPGSILLNAQSYELQTYLAGQIARAAAIYRVDEIVVFNDTKSTPLEEGLDDKQWNACLKLGRILQYLECPQYLRKLVFPMHKHLEHAGLLNPLDAPHHYRSFELTTFRDGVVTGKPIKEGTGSFVNVGLAKDVQVDKALVAGTRVTVKMPSIDDTNPKKLRGIVVPPSLPRAECGLYWGYTVRLARTLASVISESPYRRSYDLTIGTSEKGEDLRQIKFNNFHHCLIVFGGVEGLESVLETDETLRVDEVPDLFDYYVNTCPDQGSRTIRTEEAILISLAQLSNKLQINFSPAKTSNALMAKPVEPTSAGTDTPDNNSNALTAKPVEETSASTDTNNSKALTAKPVEQKSANNTLP